MVLLEVLISLLMGEKTGGLSGKASEGRDAKNIHSSLPVYVVPVFGDTGDDPNGHVNAIVEG